MAYFTVREFIESVRDGKYADGGYPKYWLTSDGAVFSYETVREEIWQIARAVRDGSKDGWRVVACDINWEDQELYDDHSGERIQCAYGEQTDGLRISINFKGATTVYHLEDVEAARALCGDAAIVASKIPLSSWCHDTSEPDAEWCIACTTQAIVRAN